MKCEWWGCTNESLVIRTGNAWLCAEHRALALSHRSPRPVTDDDLREQVRRREARPKRGGE